MSHAKKDCSKDCSKDSPTVSTFSSQQPWAPASQQHPKDTALSAALFVAHAEATSKASHGHRPRSLAKEGHTHPRRGGCAATVTAEGTRAAGSEPRDYAGFRAPASHA